MQTIGLTIRKWFKKPVLAVLRFIFSERKFLSYQEKYLQIPECRDSSLLEQFQKGNLAPISKPLVEYYEELYGAVATHVAGKKPLSIIRASDGEAYFLQGKNIGNVTRRHFTKGDLKTAGTELFREGLLQNDMRLVEMYRNNRERFKNIYGRNIFSDIPFECAYALIASRKILHTPWRLGIIGADNKIRIIQQLLQHAEYREYIGRDGFEDYIPVPETGTANDPNSLTEYLVSRLTPHIDVYLVGIGIAKLAVLHRLKEHSNAVFFDAGAGISALAGLVSLDRPYFADWKNFRLKNFDYTTVDVMDASMQDSKSILLS